MPLINQSGISRFIWYIDIVATAPAHIDFVKTVRGNWKSRNPRTIDLWISIAEFFLHILEKICSGAIDIERIWSLTTPASSDVKKRAGIPVCQQNIRALGHKAR